jgi:hypothetical protein
MQLYQQKIQQKLQHPGVRRPQVARVSTVLSLTTAVVLAVFCALSVINYTGQQHAAHTRQLRSDTAAVLSRT